MIMLKKPVSAAIASACLLASGLGHTQTTATVPTSLHGTYELTYQSHNAASPIPSGATATMTLAAGNVLCIADFVLADPVASSNGAEAIWSAPSVGVKLAVSDLASGFNEVNLMSSSDVFLGQFSGSRTSSSSSGCGEDDMSKIIQLFTLAEEKYPDLLPADASSAAFQILDGFLYRSYPGSGITLAFRDGTVYARGGQFGDQAVSVGQIAALIAELQGQTPGSVEEPVVEVPEGDYNLTISGSASVTTVAGSFNLPFDNIVIEKLPAPDTNDIQETEEAVRESMKEVGEITSVTVSNVSVSDAQVTFDIDMKARIVQSGTTVDARYLLKYLYVKVQ